jgi:hypothetical protein
VFLRGARVVESEPYAPDGVVAELLESVRNAEVVRGVAPVAMTGHTDEFRTVATEGDGRLELVFAPAVFDHLAGAQTEGLLDAIESPAVDFYLGEVPFSFGLWLADDREAGVVVYDETGIRGIIANDSEAAVRWARDQYERVARTASRVGVDDVGEVAGVSGVSG